MNSNRVPVDLLLFDFDGTLANSIPPAVDAIQKMLKDLNYPFKAKEEIHKHVGFGEVPLVSGSIGTENPQKIEEARQVYFKHYLKSFSQIPLYPHVEEMLEIFKDKTKIIISNKSDKLLKIILQTLGIDKYFVNILGGEASPCLKPDPCAVMELMKKYQIPPRKTMLVGDMRVDIETGKNAKILTCAVAYGFESKEKLAKLKPDFLIEDILELKNLIC